MSNTLKLIAQDDEQLTIISSLAQDSIIKSNEMGYDKKTKRFALLMNRYRHEEENPSRIRTAIHFDYVDSVKSVGIDKETNDGDIEIEYTGLRPGEKLFEELLVGENTVKTDHPLIMRAEEKMIEWEELELNLLLLKEASEKSDQEKIREITKQIVPEYNPKIPIVDNLYL